MKTTTAVLTTLVVGVAALATTWIPSEKTDPLTGEKVFSWEIASYGDYVVTWPSKYDLVFWPFTEETWICLNPKSGYAAFNNDFEKLSEEEKKTLKEWLPKNYKPEQVPTSHKGKLAWLEKVYGQRRMDDDFWCSFYRLMAYVHRDKEKTSLAYVQKALPLLKKQLQRNPKGIDRLKVLYLLGEYHRRLGKTEKANEYFAEVKTVKYRDERGNEQVGHPYFVELVQDRQNLKREELHDITVAGEGE